MNDKSLKEYLTALSKIKLESIVFAVIKKRMVDGGAGRVFDAHEHYKWEQFLKGFLDNILNKPNPADEDKQCKCVLWSQYEHPLAHDKDCPKYPRP